VNIMSNIAGPINLKIMAGLDIESNLHYFLGLGFLQLAILSTRMVSWFKILKRIKLSFAYPVLSITYPAMLIVSNRYFGEEVNASKVLGMCLIIFGLLIVRYSNV
jgi:undecaprenyl phosphate-alpha-L-ara4N flippase subunit ArnE